LLERGHRDLDLVTGKTDVASRRISGIHVEQKIAILAALISRVEIGTDYIKIALRIRQIVRFLTWDGMAFFEGEKCAKMGREATHVITVPAASGRLVRRLRLPVAPSPSTSDARRSRWLITTLRRARTAQRLLDSKPGAAISQVAAEMGFSTGHFMKILQLNYLAPDIIVSIFAGTQPSLLTSRQLIDATLPLDWTLQRRMFGFPDQPPLRSTERY